MKRFSILTIVLALSACHPEPPPMPREEDPGEALLKEVRGAAAGAEYRRVLAEAPGATELAVQDLKDAKLRLASLERRALQMGFSGDQIDPEVAEGEKLGVENGRKALEDRAARQAEDSKQ